MEILVFGEGLSALDNAYRILLLASLTIVSLMVCVCLVRVILGPRFTDRIVAINVICTKGVILIAVFSCLSGEKNLLDIAIIYAMIGFLAVVVLSKCYFLPRRINPAHPNYRSETLKHKRGVVRPQNGKKEGEE